MKITPNVATRANAMAAFAVFALVALLGGCGGGDSRDVAACTQRGIAYFKEIGSYPRLGKGQLASDVALERCSRTTTAF